MCYCDSGKLFSFLSLVIIIIMDNHRPLIKW